MSCETSPTRQREWACFPRALEVAAIHPRPAAGPVFEPPAASRARDAVRSASYTDRARHRRDQNSRTRTGHRQNFTELEITAIGGKAAVKKAPPKKAEAPKKEATPKAAAPKKAAPKKAAKAEGGDDLSKISGIGPVIVGKLEALGITTFQQIADFTAEDIVRIDGELNFKGRIDRDEWVKQATEFAKS